MRHIPTLDPLVIILNAPVYILYSATTIVGFVSIKIWRNVTELGTLYVYPTYRGNSYGELLSSAVTREYKKVSLLCKPELIPLYERMGFRIDTNPAKNMKLRKRLFDLFLSTCTGYTITIMSKK